MSKPAATAWTARPRVAQALLAAGISCERCPNPFNPELRAWRYPDTAAARQIVAAALAEIEAEKGRAAE